MAPAGGNSPPAPPGVGRACGSPSASHAIKSLKRERRGRNKYVITYVTFQRKIVCFVHARPCRIRAVKKYTVTGDGPLLLPPHENFAYFSFLTYTGRYPSFVGRLSVVRARHRPVCRAEQPSWVRSGVSSVDSSGVQQFTSYHASYHASYIIVYRIIGPSRCGPAIIGRAPGYEKAARGLRPGSAPAACPRSGGNEKGL